ncbi:hypothetical protein [Phenylobacterium kunshanense]|uniref:Uncharacterized protein n=1 Tax=Phenylobacterium kunshanense TaxID=1445034 RepID=A0A328BQ79_9CAUL|nr:hypothetical protein [Phenylobacterium kunshanense]RAK68835.1 hypothetical protein DJ019_02130 [Phenylobacterium kunshanense]
MRLEALVERFDKSEADRANFRIEQAITQQRMTQGLADLFQKVEDLEVKLGEEPDSDGNGGRGLIGDLRKVSRDVRALMDLRLQVVGAVGALVLTGTLLVLGATKWIEGIVKGAST